MGGFLLSIQREPYQKQPLTALEHIQLLASRGLEIGDESRATHYLTFIGYFRLSGYFPPFREQPEDGDSRFRVDATFNRVLDLYIFDRKMRLLLIDALERVEVAVRSVMSNQMALTHGPFWLSKRELFNHPHHAEILKTVKEAIDLRDGRNHHAFLNHYATKYQEDFPPSWMVFETLSFGPVSHIYRRLRGANQKLVSSQFGLDQGIFESWLHSLTFSRNLVAHHSRTWNRAFTIQPRIPRKIADAWPQESSSRLYGLCVMINYLMYLIADGSRWPDRLRSLLDEYPNIPLAPMGFPKNWKEFAFWRQRFSSAEGQAVMCPVTSGLCYAPPSD